ncbi:MAG: hypothetical protein KKB59_19195 [Spirochaetes bacterium]|nr:hypothetical protein [Spirochaetota bacterium]
MSEMTTDKAAAILLLNALPQFVANLRLMEDPTVLIQVPGLESVIGPFTASQITGRARQIAMGWAGQLVDSIAPPKEDDDVAPG